MLQIHTIFIYITIYVSVYHIFPKKNKNYPRNIQVLNDAHHRQKVTRYAWCVLLNSKLNVETQSYFVLKI